ncbi:MAG: type II toxin-antitoxin system VapC family toxin [Verrucomicrobiota bacterium]
MILPDANLLLYAEDTSSRHHEFSRLWWDGCLSGTERVCLCWQVVVAFIRIATNPRLHEYPLTQEEAINRVESWLDQPCVRLIAPGGLHWQEFKTLLIESEALGNLVSDVHLAALAQEHGCVLYSTDRDFARFRSLKWVNPVDGQN